MSDIASAEDIEDIKNLNWRVAHSLWAIANNAHHDPRLKWPVTRGAKTRVSEQESKILFCHYLDRSRWFYSIETPTREKYVQSGQTPLSARTDITLYGDASAHKRRINIELKAHNPPTESIRKDLEKLIREGLTGVWFHTLENTNRRTIPRLFEKIVESFDSLKSGFPEKPPEILFEFCVVGRAESFRSLLTIGDDKLDPMRVVRDVFADHRSRHWEVVDITKPPLGAGQIG